MFNIAVTYQGYRAGNFRLKVVKPQRLPGMPLMYQWNVLAPGTPFHESTRSLVGLIEIGILSEAKLRNDPMVLWYLENLKPVSQALEFLTTPDELNEVAAARLGH